GASTNPLITNTGLGKVECASLSVSAEVLKNSEKEVKAKGTSGEAKTCKGTEGSEVLPLTITEPELLSLVTTGKDSGTLGLTFVVDLGPFSCHFEGEGSFSYATGTDVLNVAGVELKTNEICESGEGAPLFEGDFTMATANGSPVTIPAPSTPSPVLKESGVVLAEGESIRAKSTNAVTTRTALGRLECGELTFTTAVNRNSEGEISLQTTGATTKSCLAEGEPLTLTEPTLDLLSEGGDSADLTISFAADVGPFECPFEGEDTVAYTTSTDVLKITGIVLETPVEICEPLVGKPGFEGEFTLTTANGTQVKFS
ncbi:MAG TPA: hypothetical protein VEB65_08660, partial [Solirubrobacterales bacterium]|nr:hypothetical protein [Solirubrobacterales bacterium]